MLQHQDIKIISKYSNLNEKQINELLQSDIYTQKTDWYLFLKYFSLSLGLGFLSIGILFFFAYNWQDLHRFTKLGIIEFLIIIAVFFSVYLEKKKTISNIFLTVATLLTGVLFAVFGQIYQTGANAFDFFKGWTLAVVIWVLVANFEVLWLLFIALLNVTYFMYTDQVATNWNDSMYFLIFLVLNFPILYVVLFLKEKYHMHKWFVQTVILYSVIIGTIGVISGIVNQNHPNYVSLFLLVLITWAILTIKAIKEKEVYSVALIMASITAMVISLIFKIGTGTETFLIVGIFTVISVTTMVKLILHLQNKWYNGK